jgi:hypothetical protein
MMKMNILFGGTDLTVAFNLKNKRHDRWAQQTKLYASPQSKFR